MQEELLQFKLQKVWTLVNLPNGKRAIRTKWVFRNKKDEIGIVIRNKAKLMDVKSAFLYGTIEEEVYVFKPPSFEDPQFPNKVYKVEKALYGLHQAPRAWYETLSTYIIENGFRRGIIDKTLFIKKDKGDILLVQVYVDDIIFGFTKKSLCDEFEGLMHKEFQMSSIGELTFFLGLQIASTLMEPIKALVKDEEADSVDVHLFRSMIGSLMYLTASRLDIMFAVYSCAKFQVTPKIDSPFDLEAFSNSDYAGASLDRKSTIGGCQFLGKRLISWQCKKQTIVANSTTEAEYVVAANCCGQNPVFYSKTKHIEIRHHFIRDFYKKKLIQVIKIHTDHNVADLLTKLLMLVGLTFWLQALVCLILRAWIKGSSKSTAGMSFTNQFWLQSYMYGTGSNNFNFSKLIFDGMLENLDLKKFLMYPRFLQLFSNNHLKDLPEPFNNTYETPSHTKKVFSNMARQSKSFSGKVTPLFESMFAAKNQHLKGKSSVTPPEPQPTPSTSQPNVSEPQTKLLQTETPPTVSHEPQNEANIEQMLPSPSVYQRKHRNTQKHKRAKKGMDTGGSPRRQETMRGAPAQTRSERVLKQPNEPPLPEGGYTPGSDEGRLKLEELMAMCTKLSKHVLDLEKEKDAQAVEIFKIKKRVNKLERQRKSSILHPRKRIYRQVESSDDDLDEEDASKQGRTSDKTMSMFKDKNQGKIGVNDTEVVKGSGDTEAVNTADKGKGILKETEPVEKTNKKVQGDVQIERDAEARIDVDYELAARMTQEEQEKYTIKERARLLAEFFEMRKKQLAAERAKGIRNKTPTKT
ncbi:putative ribonuclease H-like domain-containing protein [Tanacetum coccineum]